jgi:hypothetical protein
MTHRTPFVEMESVSGEKVGQEDWDRTGQAREWKMVVGEGMRWEEWVQPHKKNFRKGLRYFIGFNNVILPAYLYCIAEHKGHSPVPNSIRY